MRHAVLLLLLAIPLAAVEYRWPADAGIIDVKRDFGAKGDGRTDDTAAIKAAIQTALKGDYRNPRMVHLPAGTYLVSEALKARVTDGPEDGSLWCNGWRCGLFLVGESREKTVIRLKDACPGFTDPARPQPVISTGSTGHGPEHDKRKGGFGNEGFQNTLMNFTVDTGSGNPGASGVDFLASNRGTMEDITVRSGDGAGSCGLDLRRAWPGPALIRNVSVEGFDVGLCQKSMDCSMTYEDLTFTGQKVCAIYAQSQPFMSMRRITSRNAVPALLIEGGSAIINVLDSTFAWTGTGDAPPAIVGDCHLILRNVASEGYGVLLAKPAGAKGKAKGKQDEAMPAPGETVLTVDGGTGTQAFFSMKPATRLHPGPGEVPTLPIKETPRFHHTDFARWANPRAFAVGSRTAGIQEAIDSGAEIVYLPNGSYRIDEPVILRGKLRKIIGCEAKVFAERRRAVGFVFAGVASGTVILEHVSGGSAVVHDCDQTLVIRKCDLSYENSLRGTGDVFLEDGMFGHPRVLYPQNLWARQLNSEFGDTPEFLVRHGKAWVLGQKTEGEPQGLLNIGGVTEIWGLYAMSSHGPGAWVENREGWIALSSREGGQKTHAYRFRDTWDGVLKEQKGGARETNLFIGGQAFDPTTDQPAPPTDVVAQAPSSGRVELRWTAAPAGRTGIAYYRIERDGKPLAGAEADATSFVDTEVVEGRSYAYGIRTVSLRGGQSAQAAANATTPADAEAPKVLAADAWPGDPTVVTIDLDEPLDPASASRPAGYALTPAVPVTEARLNATGDRIILRLAQPIADGQQVAIAFAGVKDRSRAGNAVAAPASFTAWHEGTGLTGRFWNARQSFEGVPVLTRLDAKFDWWWGDGSPDPAVAKDDFSARWSGFLRPKQSGEYRFQTGCRTGVRLLLDGQVVHDAWSTKNEWTTSDPIPLEAGRRYAFAVEMHHATGGAGLRLKWSGPGIAGKDGKPVFLTREFLFPDG